MPGKPGEMPEETQDSVYYLSSEVLGGRNVKPGDSIMLKVVEVNDDDLGVTYGEMEEEEEMEGDESEVDETTLMEAFGPSNMK